MQVKAIIRTRIDSARHCDARCSLLGIIRKQIDCDFAVVQALCRQAFRKYVTEDNPSYYDANDHLPPAYQIVTLDVEWQNPEEGALGGFGKFVILSADFESSDLMYNYSSENADEFGRLLSFCKGERNTDDDNEDENAREEESFNLDMSNLHFERSEDTENTEEES